MADLTGADECWRLHKLRIEQHQDQLRAKAFDLLRELGEDGCEQMTEYIWALQDSERPFVRLLATLAEVGYDTTLMAQIMEGRP